MKFTRIIFIALLTVFAFEAEAQSMGYYQKQDRKYKKYFVGLGYGGGFADWFSTLKSTDLYDNKGGVIRAGDIRFRAKNSTSIFNMEVSVPVSRVRIGLGISFENFYLDKLTLISSTPGVDGAIVIFDENFVFEKFYTQVEVPFEFETAKPYSLGFKGHVGYFGFSEVKHPNFFGDGNEMRTFFTNAGLIADYKILAHTYFYLNPSFEYKYFRNSPEEAPSTIIHNIISFNVVAGIRFDVSKE